VAEFNPLENLGGLIEKKVPMFIVQGEADKAVPHTQNAVLLKERYEAGKAPITLKIYPGLGHQTAPEFFENTELLEFVRQQAEASAK
jgi:alpha-beta hydrolase superfamily lysophospholipase